MKAMRIIIAGLVGCVMFVPLPGYAAEQIDQCPKLQFVVVHDSQDAKARSDEDLGFLGEVVSPVVAAANDEGVDESAGFKEATVASTTADSEDLSSAASPSASDWKPDYWGSNTTALAPSTEPQDFTSSVPIPTPTTSSEDKSETKVGRTYVNITGVRTGAFIPGVHDETDADWQQTTVAGKEKTNQTITEIHQKCPNTKLALVGEGHGAAVVSEIARDIGADVGVIDANLISGVATFADPTRDTDQPTVASGADAPAAAPGTSGENVSEVGEGFASETTEGTGLVTVATQETPRGYGNLSDRTVSWCVEGDTRCSVKKPAPLIRLAEATNKNVDFSRDPEGSVRHIADVLGPAVALAGVETLAEDVNFGSNGFTFNRAKNPDDTLIGRIAVNSESDLEQSDIDHRLVAAGQQLGGMALAAGVTVAKKVLTPSNIAQIAAAATLDPMAGLTVAGVKIIEASVDLFTPQTATTGALRVMDEVQAGGVEVPEIAETAVTTVVSQTVEDSAYRKQPVTESGHSAQSATTSWLAAIAADELGAEASDELIEQSRKKSTAEGAEYDQTAVSNAAESVKNEKTTTDVRKTTSTVSEEITELTH